ncbi:MAG TPA: histidine kinase dimerization/phospho-acceptor domain-containing protein, partial [Alphaproteobacteria bacterium]|nr:histidine kinase dimerization/phospho-acceptor domain-containing protein [Alphaproteobacteria bacterium]
MNLRDHAIAIPPVEAGTPCAELRRRFADEPGLLAIPVVADGRPLGLVERDALLLRLADPDGDAPADAAAAMNAEPLGVEVDDDLAALNGLIAAERADGPMTCFLITEDGRYLGVGSGAGLLRAQNRELNTRTRELEYASQSKSQFLANMSHELRTPLNAIIGFSELIYQEAFGPLGNERYIEYSRDIHESGNHLLGIINDVLDMAKFEAGRLELKEGRLSIEDAIERCIRLTGARAERGGVTIETRIEDDLPWLHADDLKMQQVLINLLSNAIKFTPRGGKVTISAMRPERGGIEIAVSDTGVGIPEEMLAEVLKPFEQLDNSLD